MRCRALAFAAALALSACADGDDGPGPCRVTQAAVLPLATRSPVALSVGRINGTDVVVLVDTGADHSAVGAAAVAPLGLLGDPHHGTLVTGVGGKGRPQQDVLVRSFEFGGYDPGLGHYAVVNLPPLPKPRYLGGIVGANVLSHFDLDLDSAHGRLILYAVQHCRGSFLPWTGGYAAVPVRVNGHGKLVLPVAVDGTAMQAILDTGTSGTLLSSSAAERLGLARDAMPTENSPKGFGATGVNFQVAPHVFRELRVGADSTTAPSLHILDRPLDEADMLLGMDWMARRHVWISYRTRQVFIAPP